MNDLQIEQINRLRKDGKGYRVIASELKLPVNSVKSWCRRHPIEENKTNICQHCGAPVRQLPHRKKKRFCSDRCRLAWWSEHPEARKPGVTYTHICWYCGAAFETNRINGSYCSVDCFAKARKKVTVNER
jgi:hypothetical protein